MGPVSNKHTTLETIKNYKIRFAYSCIAKRWGDVAEEVFLPRPRLLKA